jgi:type I restriction enzyme S subunit
MTPNEGQIKRMELVTLAKAFRGELVPQDPNDEPASMLLERIRALRVGRNKRSVSGIRVRREQPVALSRPTKKR